MLLSYDEIPEWHQDNDHILHGYRPESGPVKACFASWLYHHNETVNIFHTFDTRDCLPVSRRLDLHLLQGMVTPRLNRSSDSSSPSFF